MQSQTCCTELGRFCCDCCHRSSTTCRLLLTKAWTVATHGQLEMALHSWQHAAQVSLSPRAALPDFPTRLRQCLHPTAAGKRHLHMPVVDRAAPCHQDPAPRCCAQQAPPATATCP